MRAASDAGHLSDAPHYNSVARYLESEELGPILNKLIIGSALPLRALETEFAIDSTAFSGCRYERWYNVKHGNMKSKQVWVKAHAIVGTTTHIITAADVLGSESGDGPQLPGLMKITAQGFKIGQLTGDAAYASIANFDAAAEIGVNLFTAFKTNTTGWVGGLFAKMYHTFCANKEEYLRAYHRRSNAESAFSAVKRVMGESLRSKTPTAMRNELRAKLVCHNVVQLIHAMYELGLDVNFGSEEALDSKMILKFPF